jgi:hypothetical protein
MLFKTILCFLASLSIAFCSGVKRDERVILFPTLAQQVKDRWNLEIHGWIYEPGEHRISTRLLRSALGIDEPPLSALEAQIFAERARFFLVDNERRKAISIRIGDKIEKLSPSIANGHFKGRIDLNEAEFQTLCRSPVVTNGLLCFHTVSDEGQVRPAAGTIHCLEETGLSVVSDIDDTIKVSQVRDRDALLRNTFCKPFQVVTGMAGLYQSWSQTPNTSFHYVSASPWQLYPSLSEFVRSNGFPAGTFHLKDFRVKDKSFFDLFRSPERYKRGVIEPLLERFPKRRFVLVGDSAEKDPEAYGAMARKYPQRIVRILIRDVTGDAADSDRYRQAFKNVPLERWTIFKSASEIHQFPP